ncbi:MAG: hypothetical protein JXM79_18070 [Sedimentisphaerales bacterium]|nr:hypothetical protein [Sedimentisphaerales bacterium]
MDELENIEVWIMKSKHWLWIVVVCLGIIAVHQIIRLTSEKAADSPSPEIEPAFQPDPRAVQTASFAELPGMLGEKKQPVIEPAKVGKPQEQDTTTIVNPAPNPGERDTVGPVESTEDTSTVETVAMQDPLSPINEQSIGEPIQITISTDPVIKSFDRGLVRGIVYSEDRGATLIDETVVQTGAVIDGVKVVSIHADGVEFEKEGRRWTQQVGETPDLQWQ